jgi:exodeoxyribonuclease V alpha subunit
VLSQSACNRTLYLVVKRGTPRTHPKYDFGELDEIPYAITIHKSQGSEFPAVVIPLATQHYMLSSAT